MTNDELADAIDLLELEVEAGHLTRAFADALRDYLIEACAHVPAPEGAMIHRRDCQICKKPAPCTFRRHAEAIAKEAI